MEGGSGFYVRYTLVLVAASGAIALALYHALIHRFRLEHYRRVTAVGYSCVVFGWMTILAVRRPSSRLRLLGGALSLPISLAPFESLLLTSILVPQASFVGHLAGILAGYLGVTSYWAAALAGWAALGFAVSLKRTSALDMPWLVIEPVADADLAAFH
eukprot:jgi/Mesen1/90/ME1113581C07629